MRTARSTEEKSGLTRIELVAGRGRIRRSSDFEISIRFFCHLIEDSEVLSIEKSGTCTAMMYGLYVSEILLDMSEHVS